MTRGVPSGTLFLDSCKYGIMQGVMKKPQEVGASSGAVGEDTSFTNPSYFIRNDTLLLFFSQVKTLGCFGTFKKK